jgi:hypothetical protein
MSDRFLPAAGVVAMVVLAAAVSVFSVLAALGIVLLGLASVAANQFRSAGLVYGLAFIALVPIYWAPDIPGTQVAMAPVVFVCLALFPIALRYRGDLRIGVIDRFVIAFVVINAVSYFVNTKGAAGQIAGLLLTTALPYATFRLLGLWRNASSAAGLGVVVGGALSALIALREYRGWRNPFFDRFPNGHAHKFFARADERFGHFRPEAAFGHAIGLGMFLVLAAVIALGLAWRHHSPVPKPLLYSAVVVILLALANTLVRGPIVMLVFALLILLLTESRRLGPGRGLLVAVGFAVLVNIGSFANVFQLRQASTSDERVRASADYRIEIWRVVSDSDNFSLLGKTVIDPDGIGFVQKLGADVGIKSFDNAFALIFVGFGALGLLTFAGIALCVGRAAFLPDLTVIDRAWAAAILGAFINLMTVNLLTQFAHLFWIGIGLVAAAIQVARHGSPELAEEVAAAPELSPRR